MLFFFLLAPQHVPKDKMCYLYTHLMHLNQISKSCVISHCSEQKESAHSSRIQKKDLDVAGSPGGLPPPLLKSLIDEQGLEATVAHWLEKKNSCSGWKMV